MSTFLESITSKLIGVKTIALSQNKSEIDFNSYIENSEKRNINDHAILAEGVGDDDKEMPVLTNTENHTENCLVEVQEEPEIITQALPQEPIIQIENYSAEIDIREGIEHLSLETENLQQLQLPQDNENLQQLLQLPQNNENHDIQTVDHSQNNVVQFLDHTNFDDDETMIVVHDNNEVPEKNISYDLNQPATNIQQRAEPIIEKEINVIENKQELPRELQAVRAVQKTPQTTDDVQNFEEMLPNKLEVNNKVDSDLRNNFASHLLNNNHSSATHSGTTQIVDNTTTTIVQLPKSTIANQVAIAAKHSIDNNDNMTTKFRLYPDNLGSIEISVNSAKLHEQVKVKIIADQYDTLQTLTKNQDALQRMLETVTKSDTYLSFELRHQGNGSNNNEQHSNQHSHDEKTYYLDRSQDISFNQQHVILYNDNNLLSHEIGINILV